MGRTPTTRVISICSLSHQNVWKLTSNLLPVHVSADEYLVYVPDEELEGFRSITNPAIEVLPQSSLGLQFSEKLLQAVNFADNAQRYGWYLQQFLKIEGLMQSPARRVVIWDADCVPVREIKLFDESGMPIYMKASECHQEYFSMIERLLGLTRIQSHSFVIPGFPMQGDWVKRFINDIESYSGGMDWFDAIISCTDLTQKSGFSETETLGTWVANSYPGEYSLSDLAWERFGQSRFGPASKFTPTEIVALGKKKNLDIISFENWDHRTLWKTLIRAARFLYEKVTRKN